MPDDLSAIELLHRHTPMRARFIIEYLVDLNGKQAAIRAGFSAESASAEASRLLKDPEIRRQIDKQLESRLKRVLITADRVLAELHELAFMDPDQAFDDEGNLKDIKDMPENLRRAIASIEIDEIFEGTGAERKWTGYNKKIKFWDKHKSLEVLAKHLKLLTEKHEHTGNLNVNIVNKIPRKDK